MAVSSVGAGALLASADCTLLSSEGADKEQTG